MAEYKAFFTVYNEITDEITTPVSLNPIYTTDTAFCGVPVEVEALWDTGATITCIKPALWERLKLRSFKPGRGKFAGIGGNVNADLTFVDLFITSEFLLKNCPIYAIDFPGDEDILIGMDIIGMGDFAVCNTDNKTSFSFVVPPFPDRINFADKAKAVNKNTAP